LVLADGGVRKGRGRSDSERKGGHEADGEDKSHHSNGFLHGIPWKRHSPPVCLFWHESRGFVEEGESLKAVHGLPADGRYDARPVGNRERVPGGHPVVRRWRSITPESI